MFVRYLITHISHQDDQDPGRGAEQRHLVELTDQVGHSYGFQLEHDRLQPLALQPLDPARDDVIPDRVAGEFTHLADKVGLPDGLQDDLGRMEEDGLEQVRPRGIPQERGQ